MAKILHQSSDKLFKATMQDLAVAKSFFKAHIPEAFLKHVDLNSLKAQKNSFIDEAYKATEADVLYSVNIDSKQGYFYLLCEHQSNVDKSMSLRLLTYTLRIMESHIKQNPKSELPIIYPLVLYTGKKQWSAPKDIFKLFGAHEPLARQILLQPFHLIDIQRENDNDIKKHKLAGLVEFILKYRNTQDIIKFLDELFPWLAEFQLEFSPLSTKNILQYIINEIKTDDIGLFSNKIQQHLSGPLKEEAVTLAERFKQIGFDSGMQQGMQQGILTEKQALAKNLLKDKMPLELISKYTGLTASQLKSLQKKNIN